MHPVRRWFPLLGWLAATLTSIVLASVAMLPVLRTATPGDGPAPAAARPGPPLAGAPSRVPSPSAAPTPEPRRTTKAAPPSPPPSSPPSSPAADEQTTVVDGWTVTTGADGGRTYLRSFRVEGGRTVIRIRDGRVRLVTATPADGYEVATVQNTPGNLAVYFNQPNHSFIVHVVWNVDRPVAQVSEVG